MSHASQSIPPDKPPRIDFPSPDESPDGDDPTGVPPRVIEVPGAPHPPLPGEDDIGPPVHDDPPTQGDEGSP